MLSSDQIDLLTTEFIANEWCNPFDEFNRGYRLEPTKSRAARITARIYDIAVKLPVTTAVGIYQLPVNLVSWIEDTSLLKNWYNLVDYCNATGIYFTITNPVNGKVVGIDSCYIALINQRYPVLVTPYINGSIDVNIRKSLTPKKITITRFSVANETEIDTLEASLSVSLSNYQVLSNGYHYDISSLRELPSLPATGLLVLEPTLEYITRLDVNKAKTYTSGGESYYVVSLAGDSGKYRSFLDCHYYLVNGNVGTIIDKSDFDDNLHQLTGNMIGVKASYIENLADLMGYPLSNVTLVVYVPATTKSYYGNSGMNALIENVETIGTEALIVNGATSLNFVYGDTLKSNTYNSLQATDVVNQTLTINSFDCSTVDNRLNSKRADNDDSRLVKYSLSGMEFNKYSNGMNWSRTSVPLANYNKPLFYTYDNEVATFGKDYYVTGEGTINLLNGSSVVDANGRYEVEIARPYQLIDLTSNPLWELPDIVLEVYANGIFLHPNVDYKKMTDGIIVWKEGITTFTIAMYHCRYKKQSTAWVYNRKVVIETPDILAYAPRINLFIGDTAYIPNVETSCDNALPYTIEYELLDLFETTTDMTTIDTKRATYDSSVAVLAQYYNEVDNSIVFDTFDQYYYLVSPMMIDVLAAIRNGDIDPSMKNILANGIAECIPTEIMDKFYLNYDPCTNSLAGGKDFVIIKAHDQNGIIEVTPDEWNFLRHVNATLLKGRITLEQYYRITYGS